MKKSNICTLFVDKKSIEIFAIALPSMLMGLVVPVMGLIDSYFAGHYTNPFAMGGLAAATSMFDVIFWLFVFLQMGTNSLVAHADGNSKEKTDNGEFVLARSILLACCIATILITLQNTISTSFYSFINLEQETLFYTQQYFDIRIFAAPATLVIFSLSGYCIGKKQAIIPLYLALIAGFVNIVLNWLFVVVFSFGISGIALATVIAQYVSCFFGIIYLVVKKQLFFMLPVSLLFQVDKLIDFFRFNSAIFLRSILLTLSFAVLLRLSASQGNNVIAANNIVLLVWSLCAHILDGFANAAITLIGNAIGAKNRDSYDSYKKRLFFFSFMCASFIGVVVYALWYYFVDFITLHNEIREITYLIGIWLLIGCVIGNYAFLMDGIIIGSGESQIIRNSMFIAGGFFFVSAYVTESFITNTWIWSIFMIFTFIRGCSQHFFERRFTSRWFAQ